MKHTCPVVLAAMLALPGCQTPGLSHPIAHALRVTPQETWVDTLSARGVQIYECGDVGGQPGWVFVAPDADLFERDGQLFGHHGAGPGWRAVDGSLVVGKVLAQSESPLAGAVPWLLLETRSIGKKGALTGVTRIRRVNTQGGVAPHTGCDAGSYGAQLRVPFTADYVLHAGPRA